MKLSVTVYNPRHPVMNVAADWGITNVSTDLPIDQPFKIAAVPVFYDDPGCYTYCENMKDLDLSQFDLVLLSDIEYNNYSAIYQWIGKKQIKSFALAAGCLFSDLPVDPENVVYRPWWIDHCAVLNKDYQPCANVTDRPFLFDVLLGARRPHRDYVMLQMQKHQLLMNRSIVCYRDVFTHGSTAGINIGNKLAHQRIADMFPHLQMLWPYVSENLDHAWEVAPVVTNTVSQTVPAEIYAKTWYSIICETVGSGSTFFIAEKFTKPVLAHRPFVVFGPPNYLQQLRQLGFKTFDSVIDENYDFEILDEIRYKMAWAEVLSLSQQDPREVYRVLDPVFQHNKLRLYSLWQETLVDRQMLLRKKIPSEFIVND